MFGVVGFLSAGECRPATLACRYDRDDANVWPGAHGVCSNIIPVSVSEGKQSNLV